MFDREKSLHSHCSPGTAGRAVFMLFIAVFLLISCVQKKESTQFSTIIVPVKSDTVLIPAGWFWMGSLKGEVDEQPVHKVWLDSFYIDRYPVTNAQYEVFLNETGCPKPLYYNDSKCNGPNQPVVGVSWKEAMNYCAWRSKKEGGIFSLPTEAQWEKASRGDDKRTYPWGNDPPTKKRAPTEITEKMPSVGKCELGGSPYGVYDLVGNVWNWCFDWYERDWYSKSPDRNPAGPENAARKVVRGGNWVFLGCCSGTPAHALRVSRRNCFHPSIQKKSIGFRCVKTFSSGLIPADSAISSGSVISNAH